MFNLREFVKPGLIEAIGNLPDYQIKLNAAGWHRDGTLTEEDMAEIKALIDAQHVESESEEVLE